RRIARRLAADVTHRLFFGGHLGKAIEIALLRRTENEARGGEGWSKAHTRKPKQNAAASQRLATAFVQTCGDALADARIDPLARIHETLHRVHRVIEHGAFFDAELDLDHLLDAARADDARHA